MKDRNLELFIDIVKEVTSNSDKRADRKTLPNDHILNASIKDEEGKSLLFFAIEEGRTGAEYAKALLRAGVPPDSWNQELNHYPLHFAAKHKNAAAMKILLT